MRGEQTPNNRIGWLITSEPIVQRLGDVKMQTDYGASSISQYFFAEFLRSGLYEKYLSNLKKKKNCVLEKIMLNGIFQMEVFI